MLFQEVHQALTYKSFIPTYTVFTHILYYNQICIMHTQLYKLQYPFSNVKGSNIKLAKDSFRFVAFIL